MESENKMHYGAKLTGKYNGVKLAGKKKKEWQTNSQENKMESNKITGK
jgi:hypothetical protein